MQCFVLTLNTACIQQFKTPTNTIAYCSGESIVNNVKFSGSFTFSTDISYASVFLYTLDVRDLIIDIQTSTSAYRF